MTGCLKLFFGACQLVAAICWIVVWILLINDTKTKRKRKIKKVAK